MPVYTLASSTRTLELTQMLEVNQRLVTRDSSSGCVLITAQLLGLADVTIDNRVLDHAVLKLIGAERRSDQPTALPGAAKLRELMATGDPTYPHLYGLFGEPVGRRRLAVRVRPAQLRVISRALSLPAHVWPD